MCLATVCVERAIAQQHNLAFRFSKVLVFGRSPFFSPPLSLLYTSLFTETHFGRALLLEAAVWLEQVKNTLPNQLAPPDENIPGLLFLTQLQVISSLKVAVPLKPCYPL